MAGGYEYGLGGDELDALDRKRAEEEEEYRKVEEEKNKDAEDKKSRDTV